MGVRINADGGGITKSALYSSIQYSGLVHPTDTSKQMLDALSNYFLPTLEELVPALGADSWTDGYLEASTTDTGYYKFLAFDKNPNTYWQANSSDSNKWIGVVFNSPVTIKQLSIIGTSARPGGGYFTSPVCQIVVTDTQNIDHTVFNNSISANSWANGGQVGFDPIYATKIRLYINSSNYYVGSTGYTIAFGLQVYGYKP